MQSTKQAIFMLGEEEYSFDIMDVNIIEKYIPIEPVANLTKNLKGIIRLRGDIIPVYSLRRKFGWNDIDANEDTRFIITTSKGQQIAYEVDKMKEIQQFEEDQLYAVPPVVRSKETSYMKSISNVQGNLVINLDHDGIVTEEEDKLIKDVLKKVS
jgi:purine-binding chemotaxis protein CheW